MSGCQAPPPNAPTRLCPPAPLPLCGVLPYNGAMDEPPIIDEPDSEPTPAEAPVPPEYIYEPRPQDKEAWKKGSGCGNRIPLYGCIIGAGLLIAALIAGSSMMRRTVWLNMDRGRRAVVQALPADLPSAERARTTRNLEHFHAVLEASKDPYPVMGEFMRRVRAAFVDQRLTTEEVEELNLYLERVIDGSGKPLMQLGGAIRNEELGIRNAVLPPLEPESSRGVGGLKFLIPNS